MIKKRRLTVGHRARILTLKEKPKRTGPGYYHNEHDWRKDFGGRHVLLTERGCSGFAVMLIGKGVKKLWRRDSRTITNQMAWVPEEDMELINSDFDTNLDFMDWYEAHARDFCPECRAWFPDRGRVIPGTDKDYKCPKCNYSEF